jgi:hypothetical protein
MAAGIWGDRELDCAEANPPAQTKTMSSNATLRILQFIHFLLKLSPDESAIQSELELVNGAWADRGQTYVTSHSFIPAIPFVVNNKCKSHAFAATAFTSIKDAQTEDLLRQLC